MRLPPVRKTGGSKLRVVRTSLRVPLIVFGLLVASATPASAHALEGAGPTNYRTRITSMEPATDGVRVDTVEAGSRIRLINETDDDIYVIGYAKEPYLRIGPNGVFENIHSPATYLNSSRFPSGSLPKEADAEAAPEWRRVSLLSTYRWHDHRTHWMGNNDPPAVRRAPGKTHVIFPAFTVPLRVDSLDGPEITVTGDLTWVPGPSPLPFLALAVAVLGALLVLSGPKRSIPRRLLITVLVALIVVDIARLAGLAAEANQPVLTAVSKNILAAASWLAAGLAVWRLAINDVRTALPLVVLAGLFFALGGVLDLSQLSRSQLPTAGFEVVARVSVALVLGGGLGLAGATGARLAKTRPSRAPAPAG